MGNLTIELTFISGMLATYKEVFNHRGHWYHLAMRQNRTARQAEFLQVLKLAQLEPSHAVADIPSGGGYLKSFLEDQTVSIISIQFHQQLLLAEELIPYKFDTTIFCNDFTQIPLASNTLDRVISLAGVHHFDNQSAFYQEVHRLLKPEGIFVLADVQDQTNVANFLNEFVDRYNSRGHDGLFLNTHTIGQVQHIGFEMIEQQITPLTWQFQTQQEMVQFCKLLFGLDLATDTQILEGLESYLGYQCLNHLYHLNWELLFLKLQK
jgi:cyclopropane fatty-acyl-phospholipid synthase-like methyltransferase